MTEGIRYGYTLQREHGVLGRVEAGPLAGISWKQKKLAH